MFRSDLKALEHCVEALQRTFSLLKRLEIAPENQLSDLRALLHSTATRFESLDPAPALPTAPPLAVSGSKLPGTLVSEEDAAKAEPVPDLKRRPKAELLAPPSPAKRPAPVAASTPAAAPRWKPFIAGMVTMLAVTGIAVGGWLALRQSDLPPISVTQNAGPIPGLPATTPPGPVDLPQTQRQLGELARLAPDWAVSYGDQLVHQALIRWPDQAQPLAQQWRQQLSAGALPAENLTGWSEGMQQLQRLADQLNALDEQKGKYLTVSELKTAVFAITQSFNRAVPVEEQLRQLAKTLHIDDRVWFKGFQKNPLPWIKGARMLVLSSDSEGFGNVVVEALLLHTPVASTRCPGGVTEILTGELARGLADLTSPALAQTMQSIYHNPPAIDDAALEKFSVVSICQQYRQLQRT